MWNSTKRWGKLKMGESFWVTFTMEVWSRKEEVETVPYNKLRDSVRNKRKKRCNP